METTKEDGHRGASDQLIPDVVRKLMTDMTGTVLIIGNDFRPRWSSSPDGRLFGRHLDDWEPGTLSETVHPGDQVWLKRKRHEILAGLGASVQGHIRMRDDDGTYSSVTLTATNRFDDPDINGLVITLTPAPDRLPEAPTKDDVRRARAAKRQEQLLGEVRSQIQTSLSSISESAAALSPDGVTDSARHGHVGVIDSVTESLKVLLDDIVDLSKVATGTKELDSVVFSPKRLLGDVIATFEPVCAQNDLELLLHLDPELPSQVRGDPARMEQVLHHLISNAIGLTTDDVVRIDVSVVEKMRVQFRISSSSNGGSAGAAILDPYSSDDGRLSDAEIRLSIAQQVVDLMEGSFGYETNDSETVLWFDVLFGHARRVNDRPLGPKPAPAVSSSAARVLVVDDSDVNRLLATSQLERLGHTFSTAQCGQEALDLLASEVFDLVLMDWHMPDMDGLEATRQWRAKHDPDHRLPIITMTASAMAGDRERCIEAGASDYLSKPVSINDLGAMITRWTRVTTTDSGSTGHQPAEAAPGHDAPGNDASPGTAAPSYSQAKVSALIADLGDLGVVRSIVHAFLEMVPQYRAAAEEALLGGDRMTVRRCAHTLKSTALMLGTDELAEACIMLEAAAAADESVDLTVPVAEFAHCCHRSEFTLADLAQQLETEVPHTQ